MADIFEIHHDSHLLVYVEDIFLYNSGKNWNKTIGEMQEYLNKISVWCKKWKLSTSPEKSSLINFSRKRSTIPTLLKICDKPIPEVKSLKILGIIFDPNITWKNRINYLRQKGFKYLNANKALSSPKIGTRSDHLLNIINATIRSIFDYGSHFFSFSSNSNRQKLELIYNAALRLALGLPRNTSLDLLRAESTNEITAKRNRRSTASDLSRQLSSATGTTVSRQTVYRRLGHIGLYARRPVRYVPFTATHCHLRLTWSREHALWTLQQ
ncbi:putative RNA-directed DNA polymerase from transposon BS [Trichonephila clavipes]|uniref:Putative RNA-directed DNA polymerase from transposon BS n=1 Tax=Trichonephila clavipes TaxID=2585209 RepID=A0A8X6SEP6_TRICX|nr:putative RNA-directed DNA polymerase from transposon BS [Trichonephila clavipes]